MVRYEDLNRDFRALLKSSVFAQGFLYCRQAEQFSQIAGRKHQIATVAFAAQSTLSTSACSTMTRGEQAQVYQIAGKTQAGQLYLGDAV